MRYAYCFQQTVASNARVNGRGYWSGEQVTVEFRPAPADSGITFVRSDLADPVAIPVHVDNRVEMPLRTQLACGDTAVSMVEHILAALHGLRIDNCEVWVDAEEMPGCDGSSLDFVRAIERAGIQAQAAPGRYIAVRSPVRVEEGDAWIEASPPTTAGLKLNYHLDYGPGPIGEQEVQVELSPETYLRELAAARTFVMQEEAEYLRKKGLGLHCDYNDLLVIDEDGPIQNSFRFEDECARHKALDIVGDLALSGGRVFGDVNASKSGHRLTAELVKKLLHAEEEWSDLRNTA